MNEYIPVEVSYATLTKQLILNLDVKKGTKAIEAIKQSNINIHFPEIDINNLTIGIFGKKCALDTELYPKDRIEIYRPLIADPKEVRKKRAQEGKKMKKGGGEV